VYAGSEEALLAAFDAAFAREDAVLSYFWTPHSAFNTFDLVELELPPNPDGGKYYPPDNLFKIVWAGLEDGAPAAWELLHNFNYSTADQVSMLVRSTTTARASRRPRPTGSRPTKPPGAPGSRPSAASSGTS